MKTILKKLRDLLNPKPSSPRDLIGRWMPENHLFLRVAELKPGDTLVVSFPQIKYGLPQAEADNIEAQVRKDLKVPDGVNLSIFFSPVDFYHLKKV